MLLVTVVPIEAGDLEIESCGKEMGHLWFRNKAVRYIAGYWAACTYPQDSSLAAKVLVYDFKTT